MTPQRTVHSVHFSLPCKSLKYTLSSLVPLTLGVVLTEGNSQSQGLLENEEPVLKETNQHLTKSSLQVWSMYKTEEGSFWTTEQIFLNQGKLQWKLELAFFIISYAVVNPDPIKYFCIKVQITEAHSLFGFQTMIQNIHCETYSALIKTFLENPVPPYTSLDNPLIAFVMMKGIIFASSFVAFFCIKKQDLLPGLTSNNNLIYQDIQLHINFACLLFNLLQCQPHPQVIENIIGEAVEIEDEFLSDTMPIHVLGIKSKVMSEYIHFQAKKLLLSLGHNKLYHTHNPSISCQ
ncbi:ribonucleotide reductase small subunit [Pisolithus tinctorius]|nr:ribonucleotide reductase small subunit [Pisolithus tinctorius]